MGFEEVESESRTFKSDLNVEISDKSIFRFCSGEIDSREVEFSAKARNDEII